MAGTTIIDNASAPSGTPSKLPPSSHRLPTVSASAALQELEKRGPENEGSGLQSLDSLLHNAAQPREGGFERGKVTELWGPTGAGKTAIMLQTAVRTLRSGRSVVWVDADTPLHGRRLQAALSSPTVKSEATTPSQQDVEEASERNFQDGLQDSLNRFHHRTAPTLSHLLALILQPRPSFPPEDTSLLIINGLNTLLDLDYPRFLFASSSKTEPQKWQAGRRYAILGTLVSALSKLATLNSLAVIVTTGCASRMRSDSGLGSALVPGVGGAEWDAGVWTRVVVFQDFGSRVIGLQKCQGRSFISRTEVGEVGKVIGVSISKSGAVVEMEMEKQGGERTVMERPAMTRSPVKGRKRTFDEVADSDGEEADEYGWAGADEDALAVGGTGDEQVETAEVGGAAVPMP